MYNRILCGVALLGTATFGWAQETGTQADMQPEQGRAEARASESKGAGMSTQEFVRRAASDSMAEIQAGQLALDKSRNPEIRSYAQRMIEDHTAATEKLKSAAAAENVTLPSSMQTEQHRMVQKLESLDGEAFDREYRKSMEKDHDKAIAMFESASQSPQMGESVREFAASTLPTLKEHHDLAENLAD